MGYVCLGSQLCYIPAGFLSVSNLTRHSTFVNAMQRWQALIIMQNLECSKHSGQPGSMLSLQTHHYHAKLCACSKALCRRYRVHCIILNTKLSTKSVFGNCSTHTETGKHAGRQPKKNSTAGRQTACHRCKSQCAHEEWYASCFVALTCPRNAQQFTAQQRELCCKSADC